MNSQTLVIISLLAIFFGHQTSTYADSTHDTVVLQLQQTTPLSSGKIELDFKLMNTETGLPLTEKDLAILHEKKLHLFIFDPALQEFRHEHPEFTDLVNGNWHLSTHLEVSGRYWIWAQGKLAENSMEFEASTRIEVQGSPPNLVPSSLGDVREANDGTSHVSLSKKVIRANQLVLLSLNFERTDGSQPSIPPYLGAPAHIVATPLDGTSLVHVHPMGSGSENQMWVHMLFETVGDYRLWVQFYDNNVLKTVPLSVRVYGTL